MDPAEQASSGETGSEPNEQAQAQGHLDEGPYYVAPDSANPLPDAIWERLDEENVRQSASEVLNAGKDLPRAERERLTTASGFFFSAEDRAFLRQLGGPVVDRAFGSGD